MKNINEIVIGKTTELSNDTIEQKNEVKNAVVELFKQIALIKPATLAQIEKQTQADSDYKPRLMKMWMRELFEEQITPDEITNALRHLKRDSSNFMPSIGQFIHWCREPLNKGEISALFDEYLNRGKPVYQNAIVQTTGQVVKTEIYKEWSSGEMEEINRRLGLPQYLLGSIDDQKKQFYEVYQQVMRESKVKPFEKTIAVQDLSNEKIGNYEQRKEQIANSAGYARFKQLKAERL